MKMRSTRDYTKISQTGEPRLEFTDLTPMVIAD